MKKVYKALLALALILTLSACTNNNNNEGNNNNITDNQNNATDTTNKDEVDTDKNDDTTSNDKDTINNKDESVNQNDNSSDKKDETVKKISMKNVNVSSIKDQTYTGKGIMPSPTVKFNGKTLIKGTDYFESYSNNKEVGTAKITITGKGNYEGKVTVTFKIINVSQDNSSDTNSDVEKIDISKADVGGCNGEFEYTGEPIKPTVQVVLDNGKNVLVHGDDYTVEYSNNTNPGTAKVTIKGKGQYTGIVTKTFTIKEKKVENNDNNSSNNSQQEIKTITLNEDKNNYIK